MIRLSSAAFAMISAIVGTALFLVESLWSQPQLAHFLGTLAFMVSGLGWTIFGISFCPMERFGQEPAEHKQTNT